MKIKEKGLSGKLAAYRRGKEGNNGLRQGFNGLREKKGEKKEDNKDSADSSSDIVLDFMGRKIKIIKEDGGRVNEADVPFIKNAALKLTGIEGVMEAPFSNIKVSIYM